MVANNRPVKRRTVLKAASAAVAASVGAAGSATAVPECITTTTRAAAYIDCPGKRHLAYVEEGSIGSITSRCTDEYGNEWVEARWNCEETWTVSADDVTTTTGCYC